MDATSGTVENRRSARVRLALGERSPLRDPGPGTVRTNLRRMDDTLGTQPADQPGKAGSLGELQRFPQAMSHREDGRDRRSRERRTFYPRDWRGMVRVGAQKSWLRIQSNAGTSSGARRIVPYHQKHVHPGQDY